MLFPSLELKQQSIREYLATRSNSLRVVIPEAATTKPADPMRKSRKVKQGEKFLSQQEEKEEKQLAKEILKEVEAEYAAKEKERLRSTARYYAEPEKYAERIKVYQAGEKYKTFRYNYNRQHKEKHREYMRAYRAKKRDLPQLTASSFRLGVDISQV